MNNAHPLKLALILLTSIFLSSCDPPEAKIVKRPVIHNAPAVQGDGVDQLIAMMNSVRKAENKPILTKSRRLTAAAREHSLSMSQNNFFSHKGLDGNTFRTRTLKNGYHRTFSAENLAKTNHPSRALKLWQDSPVHHKNMMNKTYDRVGISRVGNYWTAIFAADDR
ncbi:CAP domain-containing protein [Akkermansiaceae bacterium]|nr:CAP domain-containing protein [Akkermansiaceae bacterium]